MLIVGLGNMLAFGIDIAVEQPVTLAIADGIDHGIVKIVVEYGVIQ